MTINNDPTEEETVELIASAHKHPCPHCDTLNEEIEIPDKVQCASCEREFEVENAGHAWE